MTLNAFLLLAGRTVSALATLAVLVAVGRLRGGADLGLVSIGLAIGTVFGGFSDAGTSSLMVREAARDAARTGRLLAAFSAWRLVAIPAGLVLLAVLTRFLPTDRPLAILLPGATLAVQYFAELTRATFIARERMLVSSVHTILENTAWAAVVIGLLASGWSPESAFGTGLVVLIASVAAGFVLTAALLGVTPRRPSASEAAQLARLAMPFAAFAVLAQASARVDTVLIGALLPGGALVAAGVYFTAARLIAAFEYLPDALSRSLYPALSRAAADAAGGVGELLRPATAFLLTVGVPIPFAVAVAGSGTLGLLLGSEYASYGWILVALGAIVPLRYLAFLLAMTLASSDAPGRRVVAVSIALSATVAWDVLLLPRVGIGAAVLGALGSALLVFAIYLHDVEARFGSIGLVRPAVATLLASASAAALAIALRPLVSEWGAVLLFLGVYTVLVRVWLARFGSFRRSQNSERSESPTTLSSTISKSGANAARNPSSE